mmetsp:Transcript_66422/g.176647  ORF Transcript_66422/g.176647 Transcript_66422/m.176647 type:complete len:408 (+) Transcript_66422:36-1259(+)
MRCATPESLHNSRDRGEIGHHSRKKRAICRGLRISVATIACNAVRLPLPPSFKLRRSTQECVSAPTLHLASITPTRSRGGSDRTVSWCTRLMNTVAPVHRKRSWQSPRPSHSKTKVTPRPLLSLIQPVRPLACGPGAAAGDPVLRHLHALAVLPPFLPLASVFSSIWPLVGAAAVLHVLQVLALVLPAVRPPEEASALHLVVRPLPLVCSFVSPFVDALPVDLIVHELPVVGRAVHPVEAPPAVLLAVDVAALVASPVRPPLHALAALPVVVPLAFVRGAVGMDVLADSVRLVGMPVALVDVAAGMDESALAVCHVVLPLSLVAGTICPDLRTKAKPLAADHAPCVGGTVLEGVHRVLCHALPERGIQGVAGKGRLRDGLLHARVHRLCRLLALLRACGAPGPHGRR